MDKTLEQLRAELVDAKDWAELLAKAWAEDLAEAWARVRAEGWVDEAKAMAKAEYLARAWSGDHAKALAKVSTIKALIEQLELEQDNE